MILSVLDAVNASIGFERPIREGEQVLQAGFVVAIGIKAKNDDELHIQALVLRTTGVTTKTPYVIEIWVDLSKPPGQRVTKDSSPECQCPAGASEKCKHIIAVLLYLSRVEESDLDDLSCTDIEQQWGSLKAAPLQEYEAKKLTELCHVKAKRDVYVSNMPEVTKEMEERWKEALTNCAVLSEFSLFTSCLRQGSGVACCPQDAASRKEEIKVTIKRLLTFRTWRVVSAVRQLTQQKLDCLAPNLLQFYEEFVKVNLQECVELANTPQGTAAWHKHRSVRISASKARAQYTYYVNKKADWDARYNELYHSTFKGNEYTVAGLRCEILARDLYEEQRRCKVFETGLLVRPEIPWFGASVDGTVIDETGKFLNTIEIKTFKEGQHLNAQELVEYNCIKTLDENGNVKVKTQHYAQMQIGMLVTGVDMCEYVVYSESGKDSHYVRVPFDEKHVLDLFSRLVHVYFDKFLPRMVKDHLSNQTVND